MESVWEMNIVSLIIITLSILICILYLFMLVIGYFLRNNFIKKYQTCFHSLGCRLDVGNFLNPLNTYVRTTYKGRKFLMVKGVARPDLTDYRGEFRMELKKLSPFDLRYKRLPKDISTSKDYHIIGNYLVRKLKEEDFFKLKENAQALLDDLIEKALLLEKAV